MSRFIVKTAEILAGDQFLGTEGDLKAYAPSGYILKLHSVLITMGAEAGKSWQLRKTVTFPVAGAVDVVLDDSGGATATTSFSLDSSDFGDVHVLPGEFINLISTGATAAAQVKFVYEIELDEVAARRTDSRVTR